MTVEREAVDQFWALMRAISFFTIADGRITRLVEHRPEPAEPPHDRSHLSEPLV